MVFGASAPRADNDYLNFVGANRALFAGVCSAVKAL
jgi:hypothetical protein